MFREHSEPLAQRFGLAIAGLLAFSAAALGVTIWVMLDFLREQVIVARIVQQLPPESTASAVKLAGELRWQFRLSILVVLNLLVTGIALALLWRAYRASQESLRDVKALAEDILGSVDQAVITTDMEGRLTSINRRGLELFGFDRELPGLRLDELAPTLALQQFRRDALAQGATRLTRDFRYSRQLGDATQFRLRAFCDVLRSYHDVEIGSIIQLRDVTERSLIEERMQRMERFLELGSLAVGLHHEIKNPLAALSLHVQLLEEELEERGMYSEAAETLTIVQDEVRRIGNVLESFRDFTSLGHLNETATDLQELVSRQVRLIGPRAEQNRVVIHAEYPEGTVSPILVDPVKIEQVLLNLLLNGIEAMPRGGELTVRVRESGESRTGKMTIEVQDTGRGIPDQLIGRIFDPYFTTKGEGTGMGLAICEKIVRQHEGTLDVSSSSAGCLFCLALPRTRIASSVVGKPDV